MRYHFIANRQPMIGCLFLFLLLTACGDSHTDKNLLRVKAKSVLIEYAGDPSLKQGDAIRINGTLFWHDSLYIFHPKSTDTVYLPTQRYIADQPPGGRPVYSYSNSISCMITIAKTMHERLDSSAFMVDPSKIPVGQLLIRSTGKDLVDVTASRDYPLRVTALIN